MFIIIGLMLTGMLLGYLLRRKEFVQNPQCHYRTDLGAAFHSRS